MLKKLYKDFHYYTDLTQVDIAKKFEFNKSHVNRIINGKYDTESAKRTEEEIASYMLSEIEKAKK